MRVLFLGGRLEPELVVDWFGFEVGEVLTLDVAVALGADVRAVVAGSAEPGVVTGLGFWAGAEAVGAPAGWSTSVAISGISVAMAWLLAIK